MHFIVIERTHLDRDFCVDKIRWFCGRGWFMRGRAAQLLGNALLHAYAKAKCGRAFRGALLRGWVFVAFHNEIEL